MEKEKIIKIITSTLLIALLNSCGIAILIMMFIGNGVIEVDVFGVIREIEYSFFDTLKTIEKGGIILGEVVGFIISIKVIMYLMSESRQDKRIDKQTKELKNERFKNL